MEKVSQNKFIIGVVLFFAIFIYVGGVMTRNMDIYTNIKNETNINM